MTTSGTRPSTDASRKRKRRDYSKKGEGAFHATEEQKARRAARNKARKTAGLAKGDSREVHHPNAKRKGKSLGKKTKVMAGKRNAKIQPKRKA